MKKIALLKHTLLAIFLLAGLVTNAQQVNNLRFTISNGEATLMGHVDGQQATGTITIPSSITYEGTTYPVTAIDAYAFMYCRQLTGPLVIPNSVTTIMGSAFLDCSGFTSLTLGNSVNEISPAAFSRCKGLSGPLTIPASVTYIGSGAFNECEHLTGTVTIPRSVNTIGEGAFAGCSDLDGFIVERGNINYDSREYCNAIINSQTNVLVQGAKNTVIPSSVTSIGYQAFYYTGFGGDLTLPSGITTIEDYAFSGCGITGNLVIPDLVTSIGSMAFYGCENLSGTLTIGRSVESIADRAFRNCEGITKIISLAETPPQISYNMFSVYVPLIVPCESLEAYQNSSWSTNNVVSEIIRDCESVGEFDENMASVYPNPTNGIVSIKAKGIQSICIYNLVGAKLFESPINGDSFEYDFGKHEAGVYFIRIETTEGTVTRRVLVKG